METVIQALCIYIFLVIVFSIGGKRSLAEIDTFDFVLLLIIGESTQQALIGPDYSLTTAILLISTLFGAEILAAGIKQRWPLARKITEGTPLIIVENGRTLTERMEQIKFAILETDGNISVVPK